MTKDVVDQVEEFIPTDDPTKWSKLSSTVTSRRLELLLLREIILELRKLNDRLKATPQP